MTALTPEESHALYTEQMRHSAPPPTREQQLAYQVEQLRQALLVARDFIAPMDPAMLDRLRRADRLHPLSVEWEQTMAIITRVLGEA